MMHEASVVSTCFIRCYLWDNVSCGRKLSLVQDGDDGTDIGSSVRDEETDTVTQRM